MTSSAGSPARSANWNLPNAITVVRILMAPSSSGCCSPTAGADGPLRWAARGALHRRDLDRLGRRVARALARSRHRPRQDPRPDRRQAPHERRARLPVDPRRAAVVGHDRHRGARGRHHRVAARRAAPRQRGARVIRRQAQDPRAVGRDLVRARCRCGRSSATGSTGSTGVAMAVAARAHRLVGAALRARRRAPRARDPRRPLRWRADAAARRSRCRRRRAPRRPRPPRLVTGSPSGASRIATAESLTGGLARRRRSSTCPAPRSSSAAEWSRTPPP